MSEKILKPERVYYIDWLRVLTMLAVFLFHSGRAFDSGGWHIKNSQQYLGMDIFIGFLVQWIMPTFFILSGMSAFYSLSYQKGGNFVLSKIKRLLVPLIFGIFALVPHQVYFERISQGKFEGSFIDFYPHYFNGFYGFGGNFAWMGLHLWYLLFLFIFSMIALPIFLYLRRDSAKGFISWLSGIFSKAFGIFIPVIPILVVELLVALQRDGIGMRDFGGWSLMTYLVIFIYGYLIAFDRQSRLNFEKNRFVGLIIALMILGLLIFKGLSPTIFSGLSENAAYFLEGLIRSLSIWFWIVAIIGFGSKYLSLSNGFLKYANEAVMTFYVLHQSVIILIGYYVLKWDFGLLVKYSVIAISSFASITIVYELLIRRINFLRFLFGMKLQRQGVKK